MQGKQTPFVTRTEYSQARTQKRSSIQQTAALIQLRFAYTGLETLAHLENGPDPQLVAD